MGGGKIKINFSDSTITLSYSVSWGDCPAGCIWSHSWVFTIFADCSVESDGSFGTPIQVNSVNSINQNNDFGFYPNPTTGQIAIVTEPRSMIEILDLQGKVLESLFSKEEKTELDISTLPKGIYFVRATDKNGKKSSAKFIKE